MHTGSSTAGVPCCCPFRSCVASPAGCTQSASLGHPETAPTRLLFVWNERRQDPGPHRSSATGDRKRRDRSAARAGRRTSTWTAQSLCWGCPFACQAWCLSWQRQSPRVLRGRRRMHWREPRATEPAHR
eukprot:scaffold2808_cov421-Prasinococcus_capsulatus_cf.AAC.7